MQSFTFAVPTRVIFGAGSISEVGRASTALGRHALLVTGSTFARRSGLIERIFTFLEDAGIRVSVHDKLPQNPDSEAIDEGGRAARAHGTDFIIGLGGGSTLDAAKAIGAAAASERPIWDYTCHAFGQPPAILDRALPIVQIPIIASTGSETNQTAMVWNQATSTRAPIVSPHLYARIAVVDPALTFTVPTRYTAVGAMNIVSNIVESYVTSDEFAVSDRLSEGLIRVVMESLGRAVQQADDLDARSNLSWAATVAATVAVAGRSESAPLRAMVHPITARFPLDHGHALSALWPSFMRYALSNRVRLPQVGRYKRYALLGRQLFGVHETDDEVAAEVAAYRFTNWLRSMGMPTDLRRIGVEESVISELSRKAVTVSGDGAKLTTGLTAQDIEHIYEGALRAL